MATPMGPLNLFKRSICWGQHEVDMMHPGAQNYKHIFRVAALALRKFRHVHPEWIVTTILLYLPKLGTAYGTCSLLPHGLGKVALTKVVEDNFDELLLPIDDTKAFQEIIGSSGVSEPQAKASATTATKGTGRGGGKKGGGGRGKKGSVKRAKANNMKKAKGKLSRAAVARARAAPAPAPLPQEEQAGASIDIVAASDSAVAVEDPSIASKPKDFFMFITLSSAYLKKLIPGKTRRPQPLNW